MMVQHRKLFFIGEVLIMVKMPVFGIIHWCGTQSAGFGSLQVGGFETGETIYYQVQAKGSSFSD